MMYVMCALLGFFCGVLGTCMGRLLEVAYKGSEEDAQPPETPSVRNPHHPVYGLDWSMPQSLEDKLKE